MANDLNPGVSADRGIDQMYRELQQLATDIKLMGIAEPAASEVDSEIERITIEERLRCWRLNETWTLLLKLSVAN